MSLPTEIVLKGLGPGAGTRSHIFPGNKKDFMINKNIDASDKLSFKKRSELRMNY